MGDQDKTSRRRDVDDQLLAVHVAVALAGYVAQLRKDGRTVPPGLLELARMSDERARMRLDATRLGVLMGSGHGEDMTTPAALLSKADTAAEFGVSVRSVERFIEDGTLRAIKVGRSTRIRRVDIDAFLERLVSDRSRSFRESVTEKESA